MHAIEWFAAHTEAVLLSVHECSVLRINKYNICIRDLFASVCLFLMFDFHLVNILSANPTHFSPSPSSSSSIFYPSALSSTAVQLVSGHIERTSFNALNGHLIIMFRWRRINFRFVVKIKS